MAMLERLLEFLNQSQVGYTHHVHPTAFTAREVASIEHLPAHEFAKTVVFHGDNGFGMAVLPADAKLDLQELRVLLGLNRLRLATEMELATVFPECELGAMPPFGNLHNLPVFVDAHLIGEEIIGFNAGTHRDVILLKFQDYERLVKPSIVRLARGAAA
jgi:Ala-tRNA(Pro) deacylase